MTKPSTFLTTLSALGALVACGASETPPRTPTRAPAANAEAASTPSGEAAAHPTTTAQACEASGGSVVGDIGDGAIHRAEYRCPNGTKPTGSIRADEGQPIAIEGSVCCPR